MDYFQRAVAAFEARRFVEADAAFKLAPIPSEASEHHRWLKLKFECARLLRPQTCWQELQLLLRWMQENLRPDQLIEFSQVHAKEDWKVFHEFLCAAHYQRGEIALAVDHAQKHIAHLLSKRLVPKLLRASQKYEQQFSHEMFFQFGVFQAQLLMGDGNGALTQMRKIIKSAVKETHSKTQLADVLDTLAETLEGTDEIAGDKFQLTHLLKIHKAMNNPPVSSRDEWKKLAELLIHEDSWAHLKLAIEFSLSQGDFELARRIHEYMRSKRGYSFVKLTRGSRDLKSHLLPNKSETISEQVSPWESMPASGEKFEHVDAADYALTESASHDENKLIELGMIKQLDMLQIHDAQVPDLILAYRELGFDRVVNWLFAKFETRVIDQRVKEKIYYLRALQALEMKDYRLGLSYITQLLGGVDVSLEEYKELKYIESSLYSGLGEMRNARLSLEAVARIDPNYRRTRERMSKFA
jgi:hypothetical protein